MTTFKFIGPGIAVSGNVTVSIPHPDPCWVIRSPDKKNVWAINDRILLIFSNEEKAKAFMKDFKEECLAESFSWDTLVDTFGKNFGTAMLDHEGKEGFYQTIPIRKGI
jgi:hypothetical protein